LSRNFKPFGIAAGGSQLQLFPAGSSAMKLLSGKRELLSLGRVGCANFSEISALPELFRLHRANDGLTMSLESSSVIPFGSEYKVDREITVSSGCALLNTQIAALNGGAVGDLELESLHFPGNAATVEYQLYGENKFHRAKFRKDGEIYSGPELPRVVRVLHHDGTAVEMVSGSDLWRHRAASHLEGVDSLFTLSFDEAALCFTRRILIYAPEVPVEKRSWQFQSVISWSVPENPVSGECRDLEIPGCLCYRNVQKALRSSVRGAVSNLRLTGYKGGICMDASHLERPGKKEMEHCDLSDLIQLRNWACRQLCAKGFALVAAMPESTEYPVTLKVLGGTPLPLEEIEL